VLFFFNWPVFVSTGIFIFQYALTLGATHIIFLTTLLKLTIMKTLLSLFILSNAFALTAQETEFIVAAGTQRTLTSAERTLSVKKFSLGDNVTIIIPAHMDGWTVTATDAAIGKNVKIIGQANVGFPGVGAMTPASAPACSTGYTAANGTHGQPGSPGKNVSLNLNIKSIGTLTIEVIGGKGGNGGAGGNGGKGGNATCTCNAGKGGNGGNGGFPGNGGAGGNVSIVYTKVGNVSVSNSNFIIRNIGGLHGLGGYGGAGGQGGAGGGCSDPKALVKPAGAAGLNGARASDGQPGRNGITTIKAG